MTIGQTFLTFLNFCCNILPGIFCVVQNDPPVIPIRRKLAYLPWRDTLDTRVRRQL